MEGYRAAILAGIVLCASMASAQPTSLPLTDDSYVHGTYPDLNYGTRSYFLVHTWGPQHGLVRFDAASLAGLGVNSATMSLYVDSIKKDGTIRVYPITSGWSEATVNWDNQPPAESSPVAVVDLTTGDAGNEVVFDVTATVQRWADGSLPDAGFLITSDDWVKVYFDSKEMAGGTPAMLLVTTGEPAFTGEAIVLDLSDPDGCDIDEPGYYVLDRSWLLSPDGQILGNASCSPVRISASGHVTLDLRGFSIDSGDMWGNYFAVLWIDTGSSVTLRNGELSGIHVAIEDSVGSGIATLEGVRTGGAVLLGNRTVTVTGGRFSSMFEPSLQIGANSRVTGADFNCTETPCLSAGGPSLVRGCTFSASSTGAPAVSIYGDATIFESNTFEDWISISGNDNVVARNNSEIGSIEVSGTGNVIESNIGPAITFQDSGNFYGNNRVKLPGGFSGTEGNVDWGGNLTY